MLAFFLVDYGDWMSYSAQVVHGISVTRLKGLSGLSYLSLDDFPVTAITGANGCGKSTVLHALACIYSPQDPAVSKNYKFPNFFLPTSDGTWEGSMFEVFHSYRLGRVEHVRARSVYSKQSERWSPRYTRRPGRNVVYLGIDTCVPAIEREPAMSYMELRVTSSAIDPVSDEIRIAASRVMNRDYSSTSKKLGRVRHYRGVGCGSLNYSSLSMGAGEQRVFEMLEAIFRAPKYSLILIDEIDLLMHGDALDRLVTEVVARAEKKSLQVVFTTHRETILERDDLAVHHIFSAGGKTLCLPKAHPEVFSRLTGRTKRPIEIFVEDDLSKAVVDKICSDLGCKKYIQTIVVGAAANIFTVAAGLALRGISFDSKIFLLDGDVYRADVERMAQVERVVTGHGDFVNQARSNAFSAISMFNLPAGASPERHLHALIQSVGDSGGEVFQIAREIEVPPEKHGYVNKIISTLGDERPVGLMKVIGVAANSEGWSDYIEPVRNWISGRVSDFDGAGKVSLNFGVTEAPLGLTGSGLTGATGSGS